ncbi:MAG: oligosaccharide flippase family protein [Thermoleophilaceae bacterium]
MQAELGGDPPRRDPLAVLDTPAAGPLIIRGGVLRVVAYATGVLLTVVSAALMIRHLGVTDFGRFATVTALVGIVAGLAEAGLTTIGVREYSVREGSARDRFMANLVGLRLVIATLGAGVAVGFAAIAGYEDVMIVGTLVAGAGLVVLIAQATLTIPLQAALRLGAVSGLDLARVVATVALVIAFVVADAGLVAFLAVSVPAAGAALVLTIPLARGTMPMLPRLDLAEWWPLLRDALPVTAASVIGVVYYRVAIIVTSLVASSGETGYFGASFRIVEVLIAVPGLLVISAFPLLARAARDDRARFGYALQRMFEVALILAVGTALAVAAGAEIAIDVVAGEEFGPSVEVLQIQGIGLAATFLVATWGFALLSLRAHVAILAANASALALVVVLTLALAPDLGAKGAAIATVVAEIALATIYGLVLMRGQPELRVSAAIAPRVLVAGALGGLVAVVSELPVLATFAGTMVTYLVVLLALRAFPKELGEALAGVRIRRPGTSAPTAPNDR